MPGAASSSSRWTRPELSLERLQAAATLQSWQRFDAAICTLGLSVIPEWQRVIEVMVAMVRRAGASP
jgi:hypothetical protein